MFPEVATLESLTHEVIHNLSGLSSFTDARATLTTALTSDGTTITLDNLNGFSKGHVEIDYELIYITSTDSTSNQLLIPAWGRGYRGTVAAAHAQGAEVTMSPTWPRASVVREINAVIRSLYPTLFAVKTTSITYNLPQYAYGLPADAERVLEIRWRESGTTRDWIRARFWDTDLVADTVDFPTGRAFHIYHGEIADQAQVQVVYAARPATLGAGQAFATTTGLNESAKDLVVLGTCARLAPFMDVSRLAAQSVPADEMDQPRQLGSAVAIARDFRQQYLLRLAEEQKALHDRFPARYRRVR